MKIWPLDCSRGFSTFCAGDLVFDIYKHNVTKFTIVRWKMFFPYYFFGRKMLPLRFSQCFSLLSLSDMVFTPIQLICKHCLEVIKICILAKFHDYSKGMKPLDCSRGFCLLSQHLPQLNPQEKVIKINNLTKVNGVSRRQPIIVTMAWVLFQCDKVLTFLQLKTLNLSFYL